MTNQIPMKLLVVHLNEPSKTHYHDPEKIGSWFLGKQLSHYPLFVVDDNKHMKHIVLTSSDVHEIQSQVMEQLK
jgi:hypothetical protein